MAPSITKPYIIIDKMCIRDSVTTIEFVVLVAVGAVVFGAVLSK